MEFTIRYRSRGMCKRNGSCESSLIFIDVLQRLKIIPKDAVHIDLTESPPPSPRIKREVKGNIIKREPAKIGRTEQNVRRESVNDRPSGEAGTPQLHGTPADSPNDTHATGEQREKKRKAIQDELREVELEQQNVTLEQKKLRLTKALAEVDGNGK
jgi:hypothetical protein